MLQVEKYNIRIVNTGDKYGRDDCLTNEKEPLLEFYDRRFNHKCSMGRGPMMRLNAFWQACRPSWQKR